MRCVNAEPGISELALGALAEKVKSYKDEGKQLHVCLVSDEMAIRKQVTWNAAIETFDGFATTANTKSKPNSNLPLAKDALVFMAVGPNFKIAVAYFLLSGLQAVDRALLTKEVIRNIDLTGAKTISLTVDALYANISVFKLLGADFKLEKPYFPRPNKPNERIYAILDPPHMMKLIRKYFSEQQLYYMDDKLDWSLLIKLAEKQDSENFEMGNKLSKHHINWKETPMVVRLAVETLSNSVADALEQLKEDKFEDFIGCESLIKFIRLHNNVFDFLNYGEGKKTDDNFKNFLCERNIDKYLELFKEYKEFISKMTVDEVRGKGKNKRTIRKNVLNSRSSAGFFGFWHNITSAVEIYYYYVQNGPLEHFFNFQFSQDHLETFFSLIRQSLGANNNPSSKQFEYAYRKLLVCAPNLSAEKTNCIISASDLLTVSSAQQLIQQSARGQTQLSYEGSSAIERIQIEMCFDELINPEIDDFQKHTFAFLASTIEANIIKKLQARSVSGCKDCLNIFNENDKINDRFLTKKNRSSNIDQPCRSTVNIIVAGTTVMTNLQSESHVEFDVLIKAILSCLDIDQLYELSQFDDHQGHGILLNSSQTHKEQFISNILREFMHIKSRKICNRITVEEHKGKNKRKLNTKNTIFAGQ